MIIHNDQDGVYIGHRWLSEIVVKSKARVSYSENGCKGNVHMESFNGAEYFIRRKLERQYVVATLSTYHRRVFIKYDGKVIKTFPFPFVGKVVDPIA